MRAGFVVALAVWSISAPCQAQFGAALGAGVDQWNRQQEINLMRQQNERTIQFEEQRIERERKQRELERQRREMEQAERRQAFAAETRRCEEILRLISAYTQSNDEAEQKAGRSVAKSMEKAMAKQEGLCPKASVADVQGLLSSAAKEEREFLTLIEKATAFKKKNARLYSDEAINTYFTETIISLTAGNNFSDPDAKIAVAHKLVLEKFKPNKRKSS